MNKAGNEGERCVEEVAVGSVSILPHSVLANTPYPGYNYPKKPTNRPASLTMSGKKSIKVQVKKDHISKQTKSKPEHALAEIIWNALDANATQGEVQVKENPTEGLGIEQTIIKDNGHGMPYHEAESLFSSLGGSWKSQHKVSKQQQRFLHGQEGKGRFKAFALGRVVEWYFNYKENDQFFAFDLQGRADDIEQFLLSDLTQADHSGISFLE